MATFEDPTLVQKLDANLGPEAAATAKKMKFLNFFVSLFLLGQGLWCWALLGTKRHTTLTPAHAFAITVKPNRSTAQAGSRATA